MTTFADQAKELIARAREGGDLYVLAAAQQAEALLDEGPWQIWPHSCADFGAAGADTVQRILYARHCGPWELKMRAALGELAAELAEAGDASGAEVAGSLADQAETMGDQAEAVLPGPANVVIPSWIKWAVGIIAARELLNAWEILKS